MIKVTISLEYNISYEEIHKKLRGQDAKVNKAHEK
jgi:hypothetical protein